jgi:tyrosyl-tRNA synthetase
VEKKEEHPMKAKKKLAYEIVTELHNKYDAEKAAKTFENIVQKEEQPYDIPTITLTQSKIAKASIADVLTETNLALSKSDAKRLIDQGGVRIGDNAINDSQQLFETLLKDEEALIQVGKRRFVKIKVEK